MDPMVAFGWPPVEWESQHWEPSGRPSRADRLFRTYEAAVPPFIAGLDVRLGGEAAARAEEAAAEIARLDAQAGDHLADLTGALLRSESVASSKIERLDATSRELGIAALRRGNRRGDATLVLRNVDAMQRALRVADTSRSFVVDDILGIHGILLRDDPHEADSAGKVRTEQNWIGGSVFSPRDALFVPPTHGRVPALLDDLAVFMNRIDLPALPQAMITHAQFETIHPFTDGNGRTGRALLHTVVRRRGLARSVAVPTSAALLADTDAYFESLGAYRAGDLDGFIAHVASAALRAAREAQVLASELEQIRGRWTDAVSPKPGSVAAAILDLLRRQPVIDADALTLVAIVNKSSLYRTIDVLVAADVLVEVTGDRRHRIWVAHELLDAVDAFTARLGKRKPR
jgi:Fic family protein